MESSQIQCLPRVHWRGGRVTFLYHSFFASAFFFPGCSVSGNPHFWWRPFSSRGQDHSARSSLWACRGFALELSQSRALTAALRVHFCGPMSNDVIPWLPEGEGLGAALPTFPAIIDKIPQPQQWPHSFPPSPLMLPSAQTPISEWAGVGLLSVVGPTTQTEAQKISLLTQHRPWRCEVKMKQLYSRL